MEKTGEEIISVCSFDDSSEKTGGEDPPGPGEAPTYLPLKGIDSRGEFSDTSRETSIPNSPQTSQQLKRLGQNSPLEASFAPASLFFTKFGWPFEKCYVILCLSVI